MAKKRAFQDILETKFRWPMKGDAPFVEAADPFNNANIAEDNFTKLVLMMEGYKRSADLAVVHCTQHPIDRDFLVYPIIFNYRQFLELSLKYQLATHGRAVGIDPNWSSHNLAVLWEVFQDLLDRYCTLDPDEVNSVVKQVIYEFAKIDPRSDTYRYPVDRNGSHLPIAFDAIHLENLADVINAVAGYFTGCDGHLSARAD